MKKAWIENNKVRDIANGNPSELFHPDIAVNFDTDVPDDTAVGAELVNGVWINHVIDDTPVETITVLPLLSPVEFKMLFTSAERIAIKSSTDLVVIDFFELINDPRLTQVDRNLQSVKDAIAHLVLVGIVTQLRADEILA